MKKSTAFWMALASFSLGVLWGFLLAPIKQGVTVYACHNGSGNHGNHGNGSFFHHLDPKDQEDLENRQGEDTDF